MRSPVKYYIKVCIDIPLSTKSKRPMVYFIHLSSCIFLLDLNHTSTRTLIFFLHYNLTRNFVVTKSLPYITLDIMALINWFCTKFTNVYLCGYQNENFSQKFLLQDYTSKQNLKLCSVFDSEFLYRTHLNKMSMGSYPEQLHPPPLPQVKH